jgi:hypothetical protein
MQQITALESPSNEQDFVFPLAFQHCKFSTHVATCAIDSLHQRLMFHLATHKPA